MKKPAALRSYAVSAASLLSAVAAQGQILFSDNFDVDHTLNWNINRAVTTGNTDRANFLFDYSAMGIPSAPHSTGGTTLGLQLVANFNGGAQSGVSVSPTGLSLTGDYTLRYDQWMNFNGPAPLGATGSTQLTGAAVGTSGTTPQTAVTRDSLLFLATGDGQSNQDYRIYPNAAQAVPGTTAGVTFAAGSTAAAPDVRNDTTPYYAQFGGATVPGAQTTLLATQNGTTEAGAQGFAWHDVVISKTGNTVTWSIDGLLIGTVDTTSIATAGSNIALIQSDVNTTAAAATEQPFVFGLVDNVVVTQVPEPSTYALIGLGAMALAARARRGVKR